MLIFAIDTTATTASAALTEDTKLIAQFSINKINTHSETLLPMVKSIFDNLNVNISDIDLLACSEGPGSFTGVRIGVATIKGLAFGSNTACCGVSTLEALAFNLENTAQDAVVCPVMDARRSRVYNALFRNGERLAPDRIIALPELLNELKKHDAPVYFTGDGYSLAHENIMLPNIRNTPELLRYQSAYSVAVVAYRKYNLSSTRCSDIDLSPVYLRQSQAERTAQKQKNLNTQQKEG
ncbi:MAG: tRNA (adenosine(37)-N6)-threonylcarbamoyltransferase complex dimerization subunit type 1 TsaB [Eubacteriales bacterium]|jgi:tRNA threonylcarbamoyladenosine biosynthesis protein TsaB|nr:tRNA (adenosine(37)-N6)-threonylcarbamoyltransferase complex dimerization subunit type 1 TsaB [Eubacteriales bacterium]